MCLKQGYAGTIGGATPGKKIMRLRVIAFDEIRESRDRYVTVTGARDPGFVKYECSDLLLYFLKI